MTSVPNTTSVVDEREVRKIASVSMVGSTIEWYDFFIFGTAAALVFPDLFFPEANPTAAALLSFSVFGVAFLARPLGGLVWGHFGDKVGRKKAFITALFTMAVGTALIGALPTYASIGIAAPIILAVLRFVQGLAVGGQWGGAVLMATEFAPRHRRGFYGSFAQIGVPLGVILGQVLFLYLSFAMSPEFFASVGWRLPFLASVLLIGVALYAHLRLEDTPAFKHLQEAKAAKDTAEGATSAAAQPSGRSPVIDALRDYPKQILLAAGGFIVVNATFYVYIVYILDYGTEQLGLAQTTVLAAVLVSSIVFAATLPVFAAMSDRYGRRALYIAGAIGTAVWSFPFFWFADTATFWGVTIALLGGTTTLSMMYGPQAAMFSELFSAKVRYSGASLGYQLGAALGGGFAPLIATALLAATGSATAISAYMATLALLAVVCVYLLSETSQNDMDDAAGPAATPTVPTDTSGRATAGVARGQE